MSRHVTLRLLVTSNHFTLSYLTSHYVTLRCVILHYITLRHVTLLRYVTLHYVTWRHVASCHLALRHIKLWWVSSLNVLIQICFIMLTIYLWTFMHLFNLILYQRCGFRLNSLADVRGTACWSLIILVDGSSQADRWFLCKRCHR